MVVENGSWRRHYSHWGAQRVVGDLLPGPAAATRCFRANREADEWLDDGPGLTDLLAAAPATPAPTDMPFGGVHYDPRARTASIQAVQTVPGLHSWPLPGRDGWTLDFHGDDHGRQAELLPADFPFPPPPLADALRQLADRLDAPLPDPGALLALAARPPGPESTTTVVDPAALVPHDPAAPTPAERAGLGRALDALAAEADAG
ncbi:hypothetical protein GCM10023235_08610 [Kitasatospora terrestris]|uniref:Uncharacterized protein n=1 Tax=Kitasatospora terrestris TaxID=258051 RepID=A0ABP9DBF3_9ACTN